MNPDARQKTVRRFVLISLGLLVAVLIFNALRAPAPTEGEQKAASECSAQVETLLTAGATASYDAEPAGDNLWKVGVTVESDNGFGVQEMSEFECTVVMNGDGTTTTTVEELTR